MAYTDWSVAFGELPSTSKWNILGTNDSGLRDGSNVLWNNNQEIQAKNSSGVTKKFIRLDDDNYMRLSQLPLKQVSTSSTVEDQLIQMGWDYLTGDGASSLMSKSITFPVAYASAPRVYITRLGIISGSNPTVITDFTGGGQATANPQYWDARDITTSGFTAEQARFSGTFGATTRYGLAWLAIGAKA